MCFDNYNQKVTLATNFYNEAPYIKNDQYIWLGIIIDNVASHSIIYHWVHFLFLIMDILIILLVESITIRYQGLCVRYIS